MSTGTCRGRTATKWRKFAVATVEEGGLGRRPQRPVDEVTGLGKDRGGNHENIRCALESVRKP